MRDQSKLTCLIHGPIYLSHECKILNDFGNKYAKGRHFNESMKNPIFKISFGIRKM